MLNPTAAQQSAWQLLGYKRYLSRSELRALHAQHAAQILAEPPASDQVSDTAAEPPPFGRVNKARSTDHPPPAAAADTALDVPVPVSAAPAQAQSAGAVQIFALSGATVLVMTARAVAFVLPPLWHDGADWRLFAEPAEAQLLCSALRRCGYAEAAAMFADLQDWQSRAGPADAALPDTLQLEHCLHIGCAAALQVSAAAGVPAARITHPALALLDGGQKKQLWLDLLALRGILL